MGLVIRNIVTEQGEVTINLNLTLKIETDGTIKTIVGQEIVKKEENFKYELPTPDELKGDLISFGKNI